MKNLGIYIVIAFAFSVCTSKSGAQTITWDDNYPKLENKIVSLSGKYDLGDNYTLETVDTEFFVLKKKGTSLLEAEKQKTKVTPESMKKGKFAASIFPPDSVDGWQVFIRLRVRNIGTGTSYWLYSELKEVSAK